ncbi:STE24 endopeptidase [Dysgonomonas sp. PH5-45]|uniref:M48 family metallopeptidase n=1 Tax=unclassified Dysgonomonas TaxID=2630389 RepID=UPI0024734A52|nr:MULTISPECIES: M48 family metallopeptidase [unclassified Dysgonomonas]MDH6354430.1 STE24 endopeptidase [Dysgonomonas sp. PH5-45]MDH6387329.1 STE24 endopeptidase [Dysgonomonas sp. PH5-37]
MVLYWVIILIVTLDFVWEQYLAYRNRRRMSTGIPEQLKGIYDVEKYKKQQEYQRENSHFGLLSSSVSFVVILFFLLIQGFGWLDGEVRAWTSNPILVSLVFVGILFIANDIIGLPFSYYATFAIEEKFGFNKSTRKTFWLDQLKSLFLSVIIGGLILTLLIWFYQSFGTMAWVYAWVVVTVFSLFMSMFYSNIIVPLFNKQQPLPEGELRTAIERFAHKAGFKLTNIYVIDASKRTTKANAYFTGLGNKKRIVLYDTLINDLETNQIVAVLAHEIGHYKKKHTLQHLLFSIPYTGVMLFLLSYFIGSESIAHALGSDVPSFHLGAIAFSILFTPISLVLGLVQNVISRKNEYQADAFAAKYGLSDALIDGLKKLSTKSLSNLNPDPLNVFFYYSHPTLLQRMKRLNSK